MRKIILISTFVSFIVISCVSNKNEPSLVIHEYAVVYLTAKNTMDRLTKKDDLKFDSLEQPVENYPTIIIDPNKQFQTIIGIGGAITDAAAETWAKLPENKQNEIIRAYYSVEEGIGYSIGRIPIHSCDFSSESYTYIKDNDTSLSTFNIEHDLKFRIPMIQKALKMAKDSIKFFGSPWSPPAWMKTNNNMLHGGNLKPDCMNSWAHYFVRFIEEYNKQGINIWGITVQNEPMAVQTWESCVFTGEEECNFVKNYLGPVLQHSGMQNIKLMIWDHNRGLMYQRAKSVYDDPEAAKYVWGMGYHWYDGDHFNNMQMVHDAWPDKNLFFTEGCTYPYDSSKVNDWNWGETYGWSMIHDFNNWAVGFTDWNILLDEKGGPNHVGNYCYAPIHGDTRTGNLTYQNSYYYIGHFSRFVRPGAKRVACTSSSEKLVATAFLNKDQSIVIVIMNKGDADVGYQIWLNKRVVKTTSPAHSMMTVIM